MYYWESVHISAVSPGEANEAEDIFINRTGTSDTYTNPQGPTPKVRTSQD